VASAPSASSWGLAALFSAAAFSAAIVLIVAQNLWVLGAALVLLARGASASEAAPARQGPQDIRIHRTAADHGG
jgi:hypothetical protein